MFDKGSFNDANGHSLLIVAEQKRCWAGYLMLITLAAQQREPPPKKGNLAQRSGDASSIPACICAGLNSHWKVDTQGKLRPKCKHFFFPYPSSKIRGSLASFIHARSVCSHASPCFLHSFVERKQQKTIVSATTDLCRSRANIPREGFFRA